MGQTRETTESHWDGLFDRLLGWPLELSAGLLALAMLLSWAPQYLTWPWWCDTDDFANLARSWSLGVLPYRDIRAGNLPLPLYVFRLLGEAFGWGRPVVFNALDACLVCLLGLSLILWSRAIFARSAPGIVGFLAFGAYYFSLDYANVAQRDWHGPLAAALALMLPQTWKGRGGLVASALLFAIALGYRPHTILFFPAMVVALDTRVRSPGESLRTTLRAVVGWGLVVTLGVAIVFLPLVLAGIADDFFRGFLVATRGVKAGGFSLRERLGRLTEELSTTKFLAVSLATLILARSASKASLARILPWIVALAGAFGYRVLHPTPHDYLWQPLMLFWSLNLVLLTGLVLNATGSRSALKLAAVALLLMVAVPERPLYCNPQLSIAAVQGLLKGETVGGMPSGCVVKYQKVGVANHPWQDYTRLLNYLRNETRPETRVANALRSAAAINGPSGRISPYSAETGLLWAWSIDSTYQDKYIHDLENAKNSVVVWIPREADETNQIHPTDFLKSTIIKHYELAAKFGEIEVWKRKSSR